MINILGPPISTLDLAYERAQTKLHRVYGEEEARQLRVMLFKVQDDNEKLRNAQTYDDHRIERMQDVLGQAENRSSIQTGELHGLRNELRLTLRKLQAAQIELVAARNNSVESSKILTEKMTLAREMASLKLELEHLQANAHSHQALFAEKLSLQHQLDAVRVEVEMEKRATQRALARHDDQQNQEKKIKAQFEDLQSDLTHERHERLKAERNAHSAICDLERQTALFESRHNALKTKLRSVQDQFRALREKSQATNVTHSRAGTAEVTARRDKKRPGTYVSNDENIGTPGDLPIVKRSRRGSITFGDKSTFSITPFLKRASGPADITSASSPESVIGPAAIASEQERQTAGRGGSSSRTEKVLGNSSTDLFTAPAGRLTGALKSSEEVDTQDMPKDNGGSRTAHTADSSIGASIRQITEGRPHPAATTKKKRKVLGSQLGRTIFDDDDGDFPKRAGTKAPPPMRLKTMGATGPAGLDATLTSFQPVASALSLTDFSPRKRARKVVAR